MRLPWSEVNARPGLEVAKLLESEGLVHSGTERLKWACPLPGCTSSDGFHTYRQPGRRSQCFVCQTRISNVDLAAVVRGVDPRDACRWLAERLAIYVEARSEPPQFALSAPRRDVPTTRKRPEKLVVLPDGFGPATLYGDILERTTLSPMGEAYLRRRGIPPDLARDYGFRSIQGPGAWAVLRRHLAAAYPRDALRAAGFARPEKGVWTPFGGILPMLIIPFQQNGRTLFVRMRTIGPPPNRLRHVVPDWAEKWNRYRAPVDVLPAYPFNADALQAKIVHLVEGELNAYTLTIPPYHLDAIGLPGAGVLDPRWVARLGSADLVVTWYDSDTAGQLARTRAAEAFALAHGSPWAASRLFHMDLLPGRDPNQLHVQGALDRIVRAAPWLQCFNRN